MEELSKGTVVPHTTLGIGRERMRLERVEGHARRVVRA